VQLYLPPAHQTAALLHFLVMAVQKLDEHGFVEMICHAIPQALSALGVSQQVLRIHTHNMSSVTHDTTALQRFDPHIVQA